MTNNLHNVVLLQTIKGIESKIYLFIKQVIWYIQYESPLKMVTEQYNDYILTLQAQKMKFKLP